MWIINFIPDWLPYVFIITGISGLILSFLLPLYKLPIEILSILVIVISSFFLGAIEQHSSMKIKIEELQNQIKISEQKSSEQNVKVVEKLVTETKTITQKGKDIVKYVDREVVKYDDSCNIPSVVIKAHNSAAKNEEIK
jgi:translation elongation factor EF-Tu-like GTPase